MSDKTSHQFDVITERCKEIFVKKTTDYGTAWRILRPSSLTDQLYIKAWRIRNIEEQAVHKIDEGVESEYIGLINYSILAMIQLSLDTDDDLFMKAEHIIPLYNKYLQETKDLMLAKNHDYGEVWRKMRVSSMTDLILMKILRVKQIEDNDGQTLISEGLNANYQDIINYAVFALIKLN